MLVAVMFAGFAMAQTHYSGTLLEAETGEPIIGASVAVKGASNATMTDIDGHFSIVAPEKATLVFSYVGMKTVELAATNGMMVRLESEAATLNEVVVTAYGTVKKSAYAGSVSVMNSSKLESPGVSITDALQGNVTGVQVASGGTGMPGAPNTVRIRGIGSFNASNSPLYVIDGVPVISGNVGALSSLSSNSAGLDILSTLNPADIENIAVIKDASAAALYGSRAANGIIAITTKAGKRAKPVISIRSEYGLTDFAMPYRPNMNGQQRRDMIEEGLRNYWEIKNGAVPNANGYADVDDYVAQNLEQYAPKPWSGWTDWDKVLFRKGNFYNFGASVNGGNDAARYFASLDYTNSDGVTQNSSLNRISARLNTDFTVTPKLVLGIKATISKVNQDIFGEGTSYVSPFYSSRRNVTPSDAVYQEGNGEYNHTFVNGKDYNPKLAMDFDSKTQSLMRVFITPYAEYTIIKDLKFKTMYSLDFNFNDAKTWTDPRTPDGIKNNGSSSEYMRQYNSQVWTSNLTYTRTIGEHNFDLLYGFEIQSYNTNYLYGNKTNFIMPDLNSVGLGGTVSSVNGYPSDWRLATPLILRGNYSYGDKYFAGASFRTDGSSRLAPKTRWGNFWSVSGAWRIVEEKFMESLHETISDLRLRASYGTNGNLPSDYYGYLPLSSISSSYVYQGTSGIAADQIKNDNLTWEKNYNFNVGLDIALFKRINMSLEWYNRLTTDLLLDLPQSSTTGFASHLGNIGRMRNRGVEFEINSQNIKGRDFKWTTNFNIGRNWNKILELDATQTRISNGNMMYEVGRPYYSYYLYEFAGIDPQDGEVQFYKNTEIKDANNNVTGYDRALTKDIKEASRIVDKSPFPIVSGGMNNTFNYKWFDLSFLFTYQLGGYTYDNAAQKLEHGGSDLTTTIPAYYEKRWQKPGDVTDIERFVANRGDESISGIANSRRLHSSDFIRLKNLSLGFSLPKQWIKAAKIDQVRIFVQGSNLWTKAKWDAYDPETASINGFVEWTQPPLKTATFGINVKF
jgi:TonB-linked SusC/RagA family outer membrane protein